MTTSTSMVMRRQQTRQEKAGAPTVVYRCCQAGMHPHCAKAWQKQRMDLVLVLEDWKNSAAIMHWHGGK